MKRFALALALLAMLSALPALAGQGDMIVRFGGAYFSPTGGSTTIVWYDIEPEYEESVLDADSAIGGFAGFEFMFNDLVGLDATVMFTNVDIHEDYLWTYDGDILDDWSGKAGDTSMMPLFLSAHFHLLQDGPVDLYAGPTVGYVSYGDFNATEEGEWLDYSIKGDFGYGVVAGVDVPFGGGNWMFSSALRYVQTGAESDLDTEFYDNFTVDVNPLIVQVGVGVKF